MSQIYYQEVELRNRARGFFGNDREVKWESYDDQWENDEHQ